MLIDGNDLEADSRLVADLCIVGAGAAGLTLAQAFDGAPCSVLLLESGGFQADAQIQGLADGTSEAPYPFLESRARRFGGTTTRWSGACIPLDAGDFEPRDWLPHSGWPFNRQALAPYYRQAHAIFGLPETVPPLAASPFGQTPLAAMPVGYSQPLDLGKKYRRQIVRSHNVTLVTHATVVELVAGEDQRVEQLRLSRGITVVAKTIVLAAGGIENARLLLASNRRFPKGLGNGRDLVGRFFMEHYYKTVGVLPLGPHRPQVLPFTNFSPLGQTQGLGTFGLNDAVRQRHRLLNMHLRCYRYSPLEDRPAVIAAKQLAGSEHRGETLRQLLQTDWPVLPRYVGWHLWNKLQRSAPFTQVRLQAWLEQEPEPHNRITLSSQRDALGQPLAHLSLRFSDRMAESLEQSLKHVDLALQSHGFGPLEYAPERLAHLTPYDKMGLHHMGATRMHVSPRQGVVDANCRVHDLANLYIAGSSVFPTGGAANPTLTIVALALRLAEHLRQQVPA